MVIYMEDIDRKIQNKKNEIATLTKMLDNAKKDLWTLEHIKKSQDKKWR
jgi:hypothetical protein